MKKTIKLSAFLGLISLGCLPDMFADTKQWDGGTAGTGSVLSTGTNWVGDTAPATSDDLVFNPANVTTGVIGNASGYLYVTTSSGSSPTYQSLTFMNTNVVTVGANSSDVTTARVLTLSGASAGITLSGSGDVTFGRTDSSGNQGFGGPLSVALTGATTFNVANSAATLTFSNVVPVTGTGSIVKTGAGTVLMGRYNTFSGGFTLQEGTVRTNFSGASDLSVGPLGTGTVTLKGGNLQSVSDNSRTYYNNIVLDGSVAFGATTVNGSGTQTFSKTSGGSTTLASDSTLDTIANVTWNQDIVGANSTAYRLTKSGAGTLVLGGSNSYVSGFTVTGGVLQFGGTSTMGGTSGGSVPDYVADFFSMDGGTIRFTTTVLGTPLTGNRGFMLGANGGTIDVNPGITMRANGRIRESVAGASLIKSGTGTFIMANGDSNYTGTTTVSAGSLLIEDGAMLSSSNVTVASGATFGGLGEVGGTVTVNGTLSPGFASSLSAAGAQVGVLTISNSLTMSAGSILDLGISASGYDSIAGITDLSLGGVIKVSFLDGYVPFGGNVYKIVDWSGTVTDNGFTFDFSGAQLAQDQYWDTSSFLTNGTITAVPEPSAVTLLLFSIGAVVVLRRVRLAKALKA
ncbi:MAG: hypothetical protein BGO12_17280 [Verrucomicrobia bacterium 61-8]|nr:autotransporter-associated beta strand repeat-containing protein [Verrucomicrobiota bacterium]OJV24375.1 MAG: hypothetical protein BGO12_17280 [Verrucomicrobia bacterium 61-8]